MPTLTRALIAMLVVFFAARCGRETPLWEPLPLGSAASFRTAWFADAETGWIAGGSYSIPGGLMGRTADGGKTWRFTSGLIPSAPGRPGVDITALHFFDRRRGLAASSDGRILSTEDGGDNWAIVHGGGNRLQPLFDFAFIGEQVGWAAGAGGLLHTLDGGRTWLAIPQPEDSRRIEARALHMFDRQRGWLAGRNATLMRTADGGDTWTIVDTPLPPTEARPDFWDIHFVDNRAGWVVGQEGTILATTDAGRTWTLQDPGVADAQSAPKLERIPRNGGVDMIDAGDRTPGLTFGSIRFSTPSRGWIVGRFANHGRSVILTTDNGGATWIEDARIDGEDLLVLATSGAAVWTVGEHVGEGAQAIYRRQVAGSN